MATRALPARPTPPSPQSALGGGRRGGGGPRGTATRSQRASADRGAGAQTGLKFHVPPQRTGGLSPAPPPGGHCAPPPGKSSHAPRKLGRATPQPLVTDQVCVQVPGQRAPATLRGFQLARKPNQGQGRVCSHSGWGGARIPLCPSQFGRGLGFSDRLPQPGTPGLECAQGARCPPDLCLPLVPSSVQGH